ncbi:hypothetical protein E2986_10882 [Frieseomelitta varia]|uniref:Uncharacterized protein n=1 Tax=Frieseomelitta varia TaxID=561572 RepID=A0A833SJY4_9HYME|nr:hypothetical protein E2986_10882 [Frieseomelitta varia]
MPLAASTSSLSIPKARILQILYLCTKMKSPARAKETNGLEITNQTHIFFEEFLISVQHVLMQVIVSNLVIIELLQLSSKESFMVIYLIAILCQRVQMFYCVCSINYYFVEE